MLITRKSAFTNNVHTMDINVTQEQLSAWESGTLIQNAMPHISADEREFIMTGITPQEWEDAFGGSEDEDEDDGQPSWEQEWEDFGEVYSDEY
jgi:hypothetical protein